MYSEAIDFDKKIGVILSYSNTFSDKQIQKMFNSDTIEGILTGYSYSDILKTLQSALTNSEESKFRVGDTVTIRDAVLKDGTYQKLEGVIIGTYEERNDEVTILTNTIYEVLCRVSTEKQGYRYSIEYCTYEDLILNSLPIQHIDEVEKVMDKLNLITIDRPV